MRNSLWYLLAALPAIGQAAQISVDVTRHGDSFAVAASAEFEADRDNAWEVLTDYDGLSGFIPGMKSSRVVSRKGNQVVVDQIGEAGLLFFTFPIRVRLAVEEHSRNRIVSRATGGNFKELRGSYDLEQNGAQLRLRYVGWMTPDFDIPHLIGSLVVRNTVRKRFGAMVDEILRRRAAGAAVRPPEPPRR